MKGGYLVSLNFQIAQVGPFSPEGQPTEEKENSGLGAVQSKCIHKKRYEMCSGRYSV